MDGLDHAADGLGPAKGLLDLLSSPLGQRIAGMVRRAPVDSGVSGFLRDVRCHDHASEFGDEVGAVVSLVRPERQAPGRARGVPMDHLQRRLPLAMAVGVGQFRLHDQAVSVLHQGMSHEA